MKHHLDPLQASSAMNAFQWCKARLALEHPEAIATVQRFEADSKFFRSLLVVLFVLIPWGLVKNQPVITLASIPVLVLAFWRYADQRMKATDLAFWYIITLEGQRQDGSQQQPQAQAHDVSHADGVVFKQSKDKVEYLLVQAKNNPQEWVLPKGHIKPRERTEEAAIREVHEESGVWAHIRGTLDRVSIDVKGEHVKVQFYLMEAVETEKSPEKRGAKWLLLDEALEQKSPKEVHELLTSADQKRIELNKTTASNQPVKT